MTQDSSSELRDNIDAVFINNGLHPKNKGNVIDDLETLINKDRQELLKRIEAKAQTFERWVGGNQATGHAETVQAVPLAIINAIRESI